MKGISAIIATILLLLIVVAIVGFTFNFFQSMFTTTTSSTDKMVGQVTNSTSQVLQVSNANTTDVVITNLGTVALTPSQLGVYVNNVYVPCGAGTVWTNPTTGATLTTVPSNSYARCTFNGTTCPVGATIKVTTPSTYDSATC